PRTARMSQPPVGSGQRPYGIPPAAACHARFPDGDNPLRLVPFASPAILPRRSTVATASQRDRPGRNPMRARLVAPLGVGLLPALLGPAAAKEPQLSKRLVTKTFSVAELVTPIPDFTPSPLAAWKKPTIAESGEQLTRLVTSAVRPYSWDVMGGPGKV